jgi:hypothetical protein
MSDSTSDAPADIRADAGPDIKAARRKNIEIIRPGKDEMNLVEYPFAALRREDGDAAVIEIEWENRHPVSKKAVKASWRVAGDPKWGLPTSADERVYLVLMELSRESGFNSPTVTFSCYDLLKRLGWPDNQKHYDMLREAFERLKSVNIITRNAFWHHAHKSFVNTGFSLIEVYEILAERPGRKKTGAREQRALQGELSTSYFKWNEVMFSSMQAGFLRTLDLNVALSLRSSIGLRLYRYLDKKSFGGRSAFEVDLAVLCERHLGMKSNPYPSKYKERLKPAHDELLARGYLESVEYEPMKTRRGEKVRYAFAGRPDSELGPGLDPDSLADLRDVLDSAPDDPEDDFEDLDDLEDGDETEASASTIAHEALDLEDGFESRPPLISGFQSVLMPPSAAPPSPRAHSGVRAETAAPPEAEARRQSTLFEAPHVVARVTAADDDGEELFGGAADSEESQEEHRELDEVLLLRRMAAARVAGEVARDLLRRVPHADIARQLDWLPDREAKNPAAVFVKAVRENWAAPAPVVERIEAQERAKKSRAAQDTEKSRKAQERDFTARKKAAAEEESARLDAAWEKFDAATRSRIESQARARLGVLGHAGRAPAALLAMRRNLQRELESAPQPAEPKATARK